MEIDPSLSQEDIDALFQSKGGSNQSATKAPHALRYDFRRTDRIPKEQIRSLRAIHDTFARSLASSLSAYLRTYVKVNVISVEQLAYREFTSCLPSPTALTTLRIEPYDGMGVLEINPQLVFPLIEILLGGGKVKALAVTREMTKIEERILESLLQLVLQNLAFAWQGVASVSFVIDTHESEPALLQILAPNEAMVVVATEVQIGESSGMMNIGIPSSVVKLLRQKVDEHWNVRRNSAVEDESPRILELIQRVEVELEAELEGTKITMKDLVNLQVGDVLHFDQRFGHPASLKINGRPKFEGAIVGAGEHRAIALEQPLAE
jgi:flagellar motor switch protein FliM